MNMLGDIVEVVKNKTDMIVVDLSEYLLYQMGANVRTIDFNN